MTEKVVHVVLRPYARCYVYIHYDPRKVRPEDKEQIDHVVYVGRGTRERAWVDRRLYSPEHRRWLRDLQYQGFAPDEYVSIKFRRCTLDEAIKLERQVLNFYRSKEVLLFNKERGYKGPVRTYDNKWMPDPNFGKLVRMHSPRGEQEATQEVDNAMTEDDFKKTAERAENETSIRYDLRPFQDHQQKAVAWYLGKLIFELAASSIKPPSKAVLLLVDNRFVITPQLDGFLRRLNGLGLPIEVHSALLALAKG